jgi:hypothetical protein
MIPVPSVTKAQSLCKLSTNDLVRQEWPSAKQLPQEIYSSRGFQTSNAKQDAGKQTIIIIIIIIKIIKCAHNTSLPHWATYTYIVAINLTDIFLSHSCTKWAIRLPHPMKYADICNNNSNNNININIHIYCL